MSLPDGTMPSWVLSALAFAIAVISGMFDWVKKTDGETVRSKVTHLPLLTLPGGILLFFALLTLVISGWTSYKSAQSAADDVKYAHDRFDDAHTQFALLKARADAEREIQNKEISYLGHVVLVEEQLEGLEISWPAPQDLSKKLESILRDSNIPGKTSTTNDAYFHVCLKFPPEVRAVRSNATWEVTCVLSRPFGMRPLGFELAAGDPKWVEFEQVIDALLSSRFSISVAGGHDIVVLTKYSRPSAVSYDGQNITVTVRNPGTRLNVFEGTAPKLMLRIDADEGPRRVRLRSLDANLHLDQTIIPSWKRTQVGTVPVYTDPGEEPTKAAVFALVSGPHNLRAEFSKLLFPSDMLRLAPTQSGEQEPGH
jgi:hypothetical protein